MIKKAYKIFFGTLDNERRLEVINTLRKSPKCVSEICKNLNSNQTTVSHNLKRLEKCGFVFMEKKGRRRIYALNKKTIRPLMNLIDAHMHEFCEKIAKGKR